MLDGKELMPWTCYRFINVCHMLMSRGKRIDITSYRFKNVCHMLMSRVKRIDNITSYRFINVCHMLMSRGKRIDNITSYRFINVCHILVFRGKRIDNITNYTPREQSSGGYIGITLSVRLSVQIRVRPITFLWFDIGLPKS